jgi:hypothetical protein
MIVLEQPALQPPAGHANVRPTRSQVPQEDVFFWQCISCSKFNQVGGSEMNDLLEEDRNRSIQRMDSIRSVGGTRLPQVLIFYPFVELPQTSSLKKNLNSCMHAFHYLCSIRIIWAESSKGVHERAYTYEFVNSQLCRRRTYFRRSLHTQYIASHAPFVIKILSSRARVSMISSPPR